MDSKYVRKTVENLLAELEKNPAIGRRMSPSFMSRYGRPLGLGIALGVSGAVGCGDSSEDSTSPDARMTSSDVLPGNRDAYGMAMPDAAADTRDALSPTYDVYVRPLDTGPGDAYGIRSEVGRDTRDALPFAIDAYGIDRPADSRDAQNLADSRDAQKLADSRDTLSPNYDIYVRPLDTGHVDVYGVKSDALLDPNDAPPVPDAGADALPGDSDAD